MTVKTTIEFEADLHGAVEAAIEAVQTAIMRADDNANERDRLEKVLVELRASERSTRNATLAQSRNPL